MTDGKQYAFDWLLDESSWHDMWHTHADWRGEGNVSPEARQPFLRELFAIYEHFLERTANWRKPYQVWIGISEGDSGADAVYLHTQNPNRDNFPYPYFDTVTWTDSVPEWLRTHVDLTKQSFGRSEWNGDVLYWVRPKPSLAVADDARESHRANGDIP